MPKKYLYIPGPTAVPQPVMAAQTAEMVNHRGADFAELYAYLTAALKEFFGTKQDVFLLAGSGTAAMECAVANTISPGEKVIVVRGGHFGVRWADMLKEYGAMVRAVDVEWGRAVNPKLVAERLAEDADNEVRAVFATFVDTSTGVVNDIKALGDACADHNALLVVDAVSGLGGMEFRMDEWKVDVAVAASQKGFMSPPGVAFLTLSRDAWKVCERAKSPRYYWDLRRYRQFADQRQTPYTPALATLRALRTAIQAHQEEGLPQVWGRHEWLARAMRAGISALALRLFALNPAHVLTSFRPPDEIGADELREHIERRYGVVFAGGLGQLKDRILRIGHMGNVGPFDIITALAALEMGLADKGYVFELGKGVAAAEAVLREA